MFKTFRKKPIQRKAFQFTTEMHNTFCKKGYWDKDNNPTEVEFDFIKNHQFQWNQYTKELLINTNEGLMVCGISDWIVKEPFDKKRKFYPVKDEIMKKTYDLIIKIKL